MSDRNGAMRWGPVPGRYGGTRWKWLPPKKRKQKPIKDLNMSKAYPLKSKKKLFEFLSVWYDDPSFAEQGLKRAGVHNETYGRDSRIYLYLRKPSEASKLCTALERNGFKVRPSYTQNNPKTVEVSVSFFKGHNWDV